jgi:hypothetical protein
MEHWETQQQTSHFPPPYPAHPHWQPWRKPQSNTRLQETIPTKSVGTGTMYGGQGVPMDINSLKKDNCYFWCYEIGHFGCDCPTNDKKINVCALLYKLTTEELDEMMANMVCDDQESVKDFSNS